MNQQTVTDQIDASTLRRLKKEMLFIRNQNRVDAERSRARIDRQLDECDDTRCQPTEAEIAELRCEHATKRAAVILTTIAEIVARGDLTVDPAQVMADIADVRIDDLGALFATRAQQSEMMRKRIELVFAKIHWTTKQGDPAHFNKAVHRNHIPVDKALSIMAHMDCNLPGIDPEVRSWSKAILDCGFYSHVKRGHEYPRRCQDHHCDLCNYVNITGGIKTLTTAYNPAAFSRGGTFFALSIVPRNKPRLAHALGLRADELDWEAGDFSSTLLRELKHGLAFAWAKEPDQLPDYDVQKRIRAFLGTGRFALGKLLKDHWLDGVRARADNCVTFLPFQSHEHWHAVGSSQSERDSQRMAEKLKEEVDAELAGMRLGLYADVVVAVIPTPDDLYRWVRYMNKGVDLVSPVASVYLRYPALGRDGSLHHQFMTELCAYRQRSKYVFKTRFTIDNERGSHSYNLTRLFVGGNHRFGGGTILSEPLEHKDWRKRHALRTAASRASAQMEMEHRILEELERRSGKPWPANAITTADMEGWHDYKADTARIVLARMKKKGRLTSREHRPASGGPPTEHYTRASRKRQSRSGR